MSQHRARITLAVQIALPKWHNESSCTGYRDTLPLAARQSVYGLVYAFRQANVTRTPVGG